MFKNQHEICNELIKLSSNFSSFFFQKKLKIQMKYERHIFVAFLNLVLFYMVLSVSIAKVGETVQKMRSYILQKSDCLTPNESAVLFINIRELTLNINLTGWGVFTINRNFILASAGAVISYGVVLAQLSNY